MAGPRSFLLLDALGSPLTTAAPTFADYRDRTGAARTPPAAPSHVGGGVYAYTPSDDDEAIGVIALVDGGVDAFPRRNTAAIHLSTNSNQFWAWHIETPEGALWDGSAPTIGAYRGGDGSARTPPALQVVAGAYLYALTPTGADIDAETVARIDAPSGSGWPFLFLETEIIGLAIPATPTALKNPALDLVDFLTAKAAGGVTLTKGTNLFVGFARRQDATPSPSVFALNTGGPPPLPYLNGGRRADVRAMVQVTVRSAVNEFAAGETIAREVLAWLHQQTVPGYVAVFARDSQPAFLGEDSNNHYMWSLNLECQYVAELG